MTEQRRTRFLFPDLLACVVATLLAVGLMVWVPYQQERSAIREIERMGGGVLTEPGGPDWLREWIGDERMRGFGKVVAVYLAHSQVTDVGLEHLKGLTNLEELWLHDTRVSDAGLELLKGLTNLQTLSLGGTQVSDAGVEKLKNAIGDKLFISR